MRPHAIPAALLASMLVAATVRAEDALEAALQAVRSLAQLNGQALACQDAAAARRAKALMLAHAPKTGRFGGAFEEGTQQAFLEQTRSAAACPEAAALARRLDVLAERLQAVLPAGKAP